MLMAGICPQMTKVCQQSRARFEPSVRVLQRATAGRHRIVAVWFGLAEIGELCIPSVISEE